jgi:hypothetical protein
MEAGRAGTRDCSSSGWDEKVAETSAAKLELSPWRLRFAAARLF